MSAYNEGLAAFKAGLGFLDNPYDSYSDAGRIWIDGYLAALIAARSGGEGG